MRLTFRPAVPAPTRLAPAAALLNSTVKRGGGVSMSCTRAQSCRDAPQSQSAARNESLHGELVIFPPLLSPVKRVNRGEKLAATRGERERERKRH